MKLILAFFLCVASVLADDWDEGYGGGGEYGGGGGGYGGEDYVKSSVKAPSFLLPIPEIGLSFDKLPLLIPIPKIILGHRPTLITKPVSIPVSHGHGGGHGFSLGGFGGHGGGHGGGHQTIKLGGHGLSLGGLGGGLGGLW